MAGLTLYLLRHAKSAHAQGVDDIDRPLSDRGREEAVEVAAVMSERGYRPDRILCSNALRTRETLAPLLPILAGNVWIEIARRLYTAGSDDLLDLIRGQNNEVRSVMVIGHNPGLEEVARQLATSGDGGALLHLRTKFPPASLAVVSFDADHWGDVSPGRGRLEAFETVEI